MSCKARLHIQLELSGELQLLYVWSQFAVYHALLTNLSLCICRELLIVLLLPILLVSNDFGIHVKRKSQTLDRLIPSLTHILNQYGPSTLLLPVYLCNSPYIE